MQSLRTRRPSEAQPRGPRQKLTKPVQKNISQRKSRVDDRIKKRLSTRYGTLPNFGIPDVPQIPITYTDEPEDEYVKEREEPAYRQLTKESDLQELAKESFDPDSYLKSKLANSTEAEIKSLQSLLQSYQDGTASDLQQNVFVNYAEFMNISKEISTLENDLLELKENLAEWRSMPSVLHIEEAANATDRRRTQRSSVADLRVLYANQMQELYSQIEGSAKFVPKTPGRHIVSEMNEISLLNPATYKPEHPVKFIILNDAVLVARPRQRRAGDRAKLVAERCWPLNELQVLDTRDNSSLTNVFKIRHGKEIHVYRAGLSSDKRALLSQLKQVAEELSVRRQREREGEHERRKTQWVAGALNDRRSFAFDSNTTSLPEWMKELSIKDGGDVPLEQNHPWMIQLTDEMTVAIALREWEKAVSLFEQGERRTASNPILAAKISNLNVSLTSALLHTLSDPNNRKAGIVELTGWLNRLHAGAAARNTFLLARSEAIKKRIRMIKFEGHIQMYIFDLSMVVFTCLKHTADWFLASFKDNDATSCFVDWARMQIEDYASMFRKQVFSSDVDEDTIQDCIKTAQTQSEKLLSNFGLDFRFLFDSLLTPEPKILLHPKVHTMSDMALSLPSPQDIIVPPLPNSQDLTPTGPVTPTPLTPTGNPALPPRSRARPSSSSGRTPAPAPGRRDGAF